MARKNTLANWAGIGAALILTGVAIGFAVAADRDPPPPGHFQGGGPGPGAMMPGMWPPMMTPHIAEQLGLSAEQKTAIHKALDDARPGLEALHTQMRTDLDVLARTRPDDTAYQAAVASASQSASQNAAQFVLQSSQLRSQVYGVLTAPQRDQLVKLEAEHRAARADGTEPKMHRGQWAHGQRSAPPPPTTPR
ncbi:MAG: Spy/CpxP family protein refolding chaperone [Pseudomonadota bacterium]